MAGSKMAEGNPVPLPRKYHIRERKPVYFGAVLKQARKNAGLLQKDMADALGVNRATYIAWENDKFKPDADLIPELCRLLGITVGALFGEGGEEDAFRLQKLINSFRLLGEEDQALAIRLLEALVQDRQEKKLSSLRDQYSLSFRMPGSVAAGVGCEVPEEAPEPVFVRNNSKSSRSDGLVRVDGDSMEPVYHDGDLLFFRFTQVAYPKQDVVCSSADGMIVKRLSADNTLYSVNPERPFVNYEDKNVRIVGVVTGVADEEDFPDKKDEALLNRVFEEELREFDRQK